MAMCRSFDRLVYASDRRQRCGHVLGMVVAADGAAADAGDGADPDY